MATAKEDFEKLRLEENTEVFLRIVEQDIAAMYNHHSDIYGRKLIVTLIPDQYGSYGTMIVSSNGSPTRGQAIIRCGASRNDGTVYLHNYAIFTDDKVSGVRHWPKKNGYEHAFEINLDILKKNKMVVFCETKPF